MLAHTTEIILMQQLHLLPPSVDFLLHQRQLDAHGDEDEEPKGKVFFAD